MTTPTNLNLVESNLDPDVEVQPRRKSESEILIEKLAENVDDGTDLQNAMERAICVNVTLTGWRPNKRVKDDAVTFTGENKPDRKLVRTNKKIFTSEEMDEIAALDAEIYAHLRTVAMPSSKKIGILKSGIYVIPIGSFETLEEWLREKLGQRNE